MTGWISRLTHRIGNRIDSSRSAEERLHRRRFQEICGAFDQAHACDELRRNHAFERLFEQGIAEMRERRDQSKKAPTMSFTEWQAYAAREIDRNKR